ncbi:MAG: excinuclease ABC subunit UvrC [Bacteroidales bacterium]
MGKPSISDDIRSKLPLLPEKPGVYQYFDKEERIIYVGKAKNLKKRVASYFQKERYENNKLRVLVSKIERLEYIVVETESDALLLENNLIKKYQPRYNVLLKDDKSFPWICIKNEPFPRVFSTRNLVKDGSTYFGPYTSAHMVKVLLELIRQLYPLRTCNLALTNENIQAGKFRPCLEYHIGNCKAPCIGNQTEQNYNQAIDTIRKILKGNIQEVIGYLKDLMNEYAENYAYEAAQGVKEKIDLLEKYKSKSTVVSPGLKDVDVFSIDAEENNAFVNFIKVVDGRIVQAHTVEINRKLNESTVELLENAILEIRQRMNSHAPEIIVPSSLEYGIKGVQVTVPQRGDKKKLLELSERNVKYFKLERRKKKAEKQEKQGAKRLMETMKKDLNLAQIPSHIECFDNSNIQGAHPVAACVVFRKGKPSRKEYRHFHIKTVEGPDDYASMEEIVYRRYKRLLEENLSLPQLIVIDGGKGQLGAAVSALRTLKIEGQITIIGIAKRLEEIFFPGDPIPIYLDKKSESLKVIQHIRNEAHRFGITFHRDIRSKKMIENELEKIPGIGPKTIDVLLDKYKSAKVVMQQPEEQLINDVGLQKARLLVRYFEKQKGLL